jgi:hypothetical protein
MEWSSEILLALVGAVLSLVFAYFPWVKTWFEGVPSEFKPLLNVAVLLVVTAGRLLWLCQFAPACLGAEWQHALTAFFAAIVANQTTYFVAVRQFKQ